jgi:hypothetical protein
MLLIYRLAAGYSLCHHNTLDIKENFQHVYETSKDSCVALWSWRLCWLPVHWLSLGFRIIRKYPIVIKSNYQFNKSGSFSVRCNIPTQILATIFLFIWQKFRNHFCTNLSLVQFFPYNSSNTFPVQIDFLSYCSKTQPSVFYCKVLRTCLLKYIVV